MGIKYIMEMFFDWYHGKIVYILLNLGPHSRDTFPRQFLKSYCTSYKISFNIQFKFIRIELITLCFIDTYLPYLFGVNVNSIDLKSIPIYFLTKSMTTKFLSACYKDNNKFYFWNFPWRSSINADDRNDYDLHRSTRNLTRKQRQKGRKRIFGWIPRSIAFTSVYLLLMKPSFV